jgi:hypothetical protein
MCIFNQPQNNSFGFYCFNHCFIYLSLMFPNDGIELENLMPKKIITIMMSLF